MFIPPTSIRERQGFSMVELLAVIGIIAILIALLMPMLGRARAASQSLVCQSNLHQIMQAGLLMASEHHGYIQVAGQMAGVPTTTPAGLDDSDETRYVYFDDQGIRRPVPIQIALAPYLGSKIRLDNAADMLADWQSSNCMARRVFTCPSQADIPTADIIDGGNDGWTAPQIATSFAYNEAITGFIENSARRLRGQFAKATLSSSILLWTDAIPRAQQSYAAWYNHVTGRLSLADALDPAPAPDGNPNTGDPGQFDYFRHHGRMNVVFLDGHVESLVINSGDLQRALIAAQ
jgi:prepilin-type N-terminal cleavage/methylation domain-containing protein/prepilin-type processing-associated H-X9-DG protein